MPLSLEIVHGRIVRSRFLVVFTTVTRVPLALAFLPSGLVKALGRRFTTLPVTDRVGYFFDGFFSVAGYYRFVGIMQLTAAALLLLPGRRRWAPCCTCRSSSTSSSVRWP